jgi:hypothetical protein
VTIEEPIRRQLGAAPGRSVLLAGICDEVCALPGDWRALRTVSFAQTGAVYAALGEVDREADGDGRRGMVRDYRAIVDACFGAVTIVPVRFGTIFRSREAALEALGAEESAWSERLARLEGCVEMGVRVEDNGEHEGRRGGRRTRTASSGSAYLRARARELRGEAEDGIPASLRARLEGMLRGSNTTRSRHPVGGFSGPSRCYNFLIRRDDRGRFTSEVERWSSGRGRVEVSGPWPPFSFGADPREATRRP